MIPSIYDICYMLWMPVLYKHDVIIRMLVNQDGDMNMSVYNNKGKIKWDYICLLMIPVDEFWGQNS